MTDHHLGARERTFAFEYNFNGERYGGTVVARSWEEAREKVKAMGLASIIGSDVETIPYMAGLGGLIVRWRVFWANLWRRP